MKLTDTEALLWSLEQDPNLASTMASVMILEKAPDVDWVRASYHHALAAVPRLTERVVENPMPGSNPEWSLDDQFDIEHHLRVMRLPAPGTIEQLRTIACQLINDPFDRTRPLWQTTILTGLRGGSAAVVTKLHHSLADGLGALEMATKLFEFGAPGQPPDPLDLDAVLAERSAPPEREPTNGIDDDPGILQQAERLLGALNEAASLIADRDRITGAGNEAFAAARAFATQLPIVGGHRGSPLWSGRSRNRRLEWLEFPLAQLKEATRQRGLRLNDLFIGACAEATLRYHDEFGVELDEISSTAVVSTRRDGDAPTANAFSPAAIIIPGHGTGTEERLVKIHEAVQARRELLSASRDLLGSVSGLAALLPSSIATSMAKGQASHVDFATSNLPGPPMPVWFGGQRARSWFPVGPVAGTAVNMTLMSYADMVHVTMHIDPAAIDEPTMFKACLRAGFGDIGVLVRGR